MSKEEVQLKINLVMDKLIHLGGADYEKDKDISLEDAIASGNVARDFGIEEWDWPQGVGLYGLSMLQNYYGDKRFMDFFVNWFESNIEKGLPSRNINTTAPYLTLLQILDDMPEKEKYEKMCLEQADWLIHELPKTKDGGFQHVTSGIGDRNAVILNEQQLWLDTLFMAVLFLQQMGNRYHNEVWRSEAVHQVLVHIKYLSEMTILAESSGTGEIPGLRSELLYSLRMPMIWNWEPENILRILFVHMRRPFAHFRHPPACFILFWMIRPLMKKHQVPLRSQQASCAVLSLAFLMKVICRVPERPFRGFAEMWIMMERF